MRIVSFGKSFTRGALALLLASATAGCGLGTLLSAPYIRDADDNDVVFIGDSIFALSGEIQENLHAWAGGTFRNYTTSGAQLVGGLIAPSIPQQYDMARADDPDIRVVVMDAAGNDILIPAVALDPYDCLTQWYEWGWLSWSCRSLIDDLYVDGVNELNRIAADGVDHVVFLGYYHTKNGLLWVDDLEEAIDYGDMRLAQACQNAVVDCTFVDPRSTIRDWHITADGVHPNSTGSRKLAELIWPVLQPLL